MRTSQSCRCAVTAALAVWLAGCQHAPVPPAAAPTARWTDGWQPLALPGKAPTNYAIVGADGRWVVHARSERSASLYRRNVRIEPQQLGKVNFSWKVSSPLADGDVRNSDTEDAVARVVLAFEGDRDRLSARTRMMFDLMESLSGEAPPFATLMYVWDGRAAVNSVVHNQRSDRVRKIVLEAGSAHAGQWRSYERDVRADYKRAFGEEPGALIGVAFMTDSDNTQSRAEAWYGEVRFR